MLASVAYSGVLWVTFMFDRCELRTSLKRSMELHWRVSYDITDAFNQ